MTARAAVYDVVREVAPGNVPIYNVNSVDSPQSWPFVVIHWQEKLRQFGDRGPQFLQIWVHDKGADYTELSILLRDIRIALSEETQIEGQDGWTLTQADWQGDSGDLYDEVHNTITRNSNFLVVSRRGIVA